ncbi:FKBP-type peptidyl-prolyl cis-trans isomerase [Gammaproteobacteria bacterium]|nr:FKBP-type peptidyl-prolyl cis-trans isomerase [Gammaproteobacteria bacterium]MDC1132022.1 FKBP-type peptidyl-prolyl cis-trans isomerase [Gammaproteobacteria bacterium]
MKKICITLTLIIFITSCSFESNLEINLQQSEIFLENNLLDSSVVEIESGLQYIILESSQSKASRPKLSDTITADFHGTLIDGSVFWSSIDIGEPLTIQLSQLIPGCQKLISRMQEGDFWRVFIHPDLAYGEEGRPTIPPNSMLIFDIKLHDIMQNPKK